METMRYKPSDKVRIKSLDWYNENKDKDGNIVFSSKVPQFSWNVNVRTVFTKDMVKFCGKVVTIESVWPVNYSIVEGTYRYYFTDEMIEGLVGEEFEVDLIPKFGEYSDNEPLDIPTMTTEFVKEHGLPCPEGYIFKDENGNVINATKIVLEKKKKEYPKTYEECLKILGFTTIYTPKVEPMFDYDDDIIALQKLKNCRNAYWKLYGEEMGLGKPWEPDWNTSEPKYVIAYTSHGIEKQWETTYRKGLAFPTEEMRDAFYENFKEEIEICKELL